MSKKSGIFAGCLVFLLFSALFYKGLSGVNNRLRAEELFQLSNHFFDTEDWQECRRLLLRVLDLVPDHREALLDLREIEQKIGTDPLIQQYLQIAEMVEGSPEERLDSFEGNLELQEYNHFDAVMSYLNAPYFPKAQNMERIELNYGKYFAELDNTGLKPFMTEADFGDFLENILSVRKLFLADELTIHELSSSEWGNGYRQRELLFISKTAGSFIVWVYQPEDVKNANGKAVLAIHGHGDTVRYAVSDYVSKDFFAAGYLIVMLQFRAMDAMEMEVTLSRIAWLRGIRLMSMRLLELLHAGRYLKSHPLNKSGGYAVIGHSGGAAAGSLLRWYESDMAAFAGDYATNFMGLMFGDLAKKYRQIAIHCETIPEISGFTNYLHKDKILGRSGRYFPYGYPDPHKVFDFIEEIYKQFSPESVGVDSSSYQDVDETFLIVENEKFKRFFVAPEIKKVELLDFLRSCNFRSAVFAFRHYLRVMEEKDILNYYEWFRIFQSASEFTPFEAALLVETAESAMVAGRLGKMRRKALFETMGACKDLYINDMIIVRLCHVASSLPMVEAGFVAEFIDRLRSPLAAWYGAIIISYFVNKSNLSFFSQLRQKMAEKKSLFFEESVRIWLCGLYENDKISQRHFMQQTGAKIYKEFCGY